MRLSASMWYSDTILWHRYRSTFTQVMTCCLMAPSHYLTNIDFSFVRFCGIYLRAISRWRPKLPFCMMSFKIISSKLLPYLPEANALIYCMQSYVILEHVKISCIILSEMNQVSLLIAISFVICFCRNSPDDSFLVKLLTKIPWSSATASVKLKVNLVLIEMYLTKKHCFGRLS